MRKDLQEQAIALTRVCMEQWYLREEPLKPEYLAEDVSLIGAAHGQFFLGKENLIEGLNKLKKEKDLPVCLLTNQSYSIASHDTNTCVVIGKVLATVDVPDMLGQEQQRVTFIWRKGTDGLKIQHMHISNEWQAIEPDETFAFQMTKQTRRLLTQKLEESSERIHFTSNDGVHHLAYLDEILYVEAANEYIRIHLEDQVYMVHDSLSHFYQSKLDGFLQIHRSYVVNPDCIWFFQPFELEMINGERLSVARSRYHLLLESLEKQ